MMWERLNDLALALVDDGTIEFSLNKSQGSWWLFVHHKRKSEESSYNLAWAADASLANAVHAVEKKLEEDARKLLEKTQNATTQLERVLQTSKGEP